MSVEWFKKCSTLTLLTPDPGAARQNVEKHASTGCLHALRIPTDGTKTGIKEGRAFTVLPHMEVPVAAAGSRVQTVHQLSVPSKSGPAVCVQHKDKSVLSGK
jgi:hypothetical protein